MARAEHLVRLRDVSQFLFTESLPTDTQGQEGPDESALRRTRHCEPAAIGVTR